ncbi:glutamine synthetase, partial [Candidatus Woesearchaeota archaeon]|nr:glutamine synthetase [Candidatus Woesearchaeota archaeon]
KAEEYFNKEVKNIFSKYKSLEEEFGFTSKDIERVIMTTATELEFWVKTPDYKTNTEKLSTSQTLKEQYWKRTVGPVRTALEEVMILLTNYDYEPEMAHKEVGGVPSKLKGGNIYSGIMEQVEVDWKYDEAMQSADNELLARDRISDVFHKNGLEITFQAKPIDGVAGSGEHHHIGLAVKLKNGKTVNLFAPNEMKKHYLSSLGWGAFMGMLKNYEVINPFVTSTNDAFNRLKPGFEAPVCIVGSLGHCVEVASRNRTVLAGLVRDLSNPLATRFELRAPNPTTNTYLVTSAVYLGMLDGMKAVIASGKTNEALEADFSKKAGEESFYLETDRVYRSEEDVFDDFTQEERDMLFGIPPKTVWENISSFKNNPDKIKVLLKGNVFTEAILESYELTILNTWTTELANRIIVKNSGIVRESIKLHYNDTENVTDLDVVNWEKINSLRIELMKDSLNHKSLFTQIRNAIECGNYDLVSDLQVEMMEKINALNDLYIIYKRNLFVL